MIPFTPSKDMKIKVSHKTLIKTHCVSAKQTPQPFVYSISLKSTDLIVNFQSYLKKKLPLKLSYNHVFYNRSPLLFKKCCRTSDCSVLFIHPQPLLFFTRNFGHFRLCFRSFFPRRFFLKIFKPFWRVSTCEKHFLMTTHSRPFFSFNKTASKVKVDVTAGVLQLFLKGEK